MSKESSEAGTDFSPLVRAMGDLRQSLGRNREVACELEEIVAAERADPFRSRHPNLRWQIIPAIYCAFYAAACLGGLLTHDVWGNVSLARPKLAMLALLHSLLYASCAICWCKNRWMLGLIILIVVTMRQQTCILSSRSQTCSLRAILSSPHWLFAGRDPSVFGSDSRLFAGACS